MRSGNIRKPLLMFVLLAFLAQSLGASALFCQSSMDTTSPSKPVGQMTHLEHCQDQFSLSNNPPDRPGEYENCCTQHCVCPASGAPVIMAFNQAIGLLSDSRDIPFMTFSVPPGYSTLPYRPPISI